MPDYLPEWEDALSTERCTPKADAIQCTDVGPVLTDYRVYPELMHVPDDYCP